jgi:archaellum component FlaG (FlaF/FlaG flagellin family)
LDAVAEADRVSDLIFFVLGVVVAACVFGFILVGLTILAERFQKDETTHKA